MISVLYGLTKRLNKKINNFHKIMQMAKFRQEFKQRHDDIYISTYPRSGTTWMQMILYQLITRRGLDFNHIYEVSPFLDTEFNDENYLDDYPSPRIIKTHLDYDLFPKKTKGRFIYIVRNGLDVALSYFHHRKILLSLTPPLTVKRIKEIANFNFNDHIKFFFYDNSWFKKIKKWFENKNNFEIYFIRYEDLKKDLKGSIKNIADFLSIPIKDAEIDDVLPFCDFEFMKKHQDKFGDFSGDFLRKGVIGEGREQISNEHLKEYNRLFNKYLSKFNLLNEYIGKT